jgi:hypothetical protein
VGVKKINQYWLVQQGVMTGTATITSSGQYVANLDNIGLEITWTGTPTGTISVLGSISNAIPGIDAVIYYALTFNPALSQPAGSGGGYLINLNQFPWHYLKVQYVNASGTGVLDVVLFGKDLN